MAEFGQLDGPRWVRLEDGRVLPAFECSKCRHSRVETMRVRGRSHCAVCEAYRNSQRTASPKSFEEVEAEYFARQDRAARGVKVCPICEAEKPLADMDKTGRCIPCRKQERIEQKRLHRVRKAAEQGREIRSLAMMNGHVMDWKAFMAKPPKPANDNKRAWLKTASDEEVAAHYAAIGKPWSNPRLSDAEKFAIRYRTDKVFHAKQRMRLQFRKHMVRGAKHVLGVPTPQRRYSYKWDDVLSYTKEEFVAHMESLFTDGMTWDAFFEGRVHIDHKRPISSFDLDDPAQLRECFSLSNLQPLWARDNIVKSDKLPCGGRGRDARSVAA